MANQHTARQQAEQGATPAPPPATDEQERPPAAAPDEQVPARPARAPHTYRVLGTLLRDNQLLPIGGEVSFRAEEVEDGHVAAILAAGTIGPLGDPAWSAKTRPDSTPAFVKAQLKRGMDRDGEVEGNARRRHDRTVPAPTPADR